MIQTAREPQDVLETLLAPVSSADFFARYFEREQLHVERNDPAYFADVYDVGEVESSIVVGAKDYEKFTLIKAGTQQVGSPDYTIERQSARARHTHRPSSIALDPRAIASYFGDGYTLLIKDAALFSLRLQKFCNRLAQRTGYYVQTNVYFTPPSAQGFDVHHDTHDTMILQIEGTKTWQIYDPAVELPLETQPYSKDEHGSNHRLRTEAVLRPGDTLYIPHGCPHAASTGEGRSLHVTLALLPTRAIDLLDAMLNIAGVTDVELRRALEPGWHEDPGFPERFAAKIAPRLAQAFAAGRVRPATDLVLRDLFTVVRAEGGGAFEQMRQLESVQLETKVSYRDDTPFLLRPAGDVLELLVAGKAMAFPAEYGKVLLPLQKGPMTIGEVDAALPDGLGLSLVKMIVVEGIARLD